MLVEGINPLVRALSVNFDGKRVEEFRSSRTMLGFAAVV